MLVSGVDIIEIPRIKAVADRYGERFLRRIYTEGEVAYCRGRAPQLATRFAAKEAVMKALGTGIRGVRWKDIEIARKPGGPPTVGQPEPGPSRIRVGTEFAPSSRRVGFAFPGA